MDIRQLEIEIREDLYLKFFEYATNYSTKDVSTCFNATTQAVNELLSTGALSQVVKTMNDTLGIK
jgi:hypothetical protein